MHHWFRFHGNVTYNVDKEVDFAKGLSDLKDGLLSRRLTPSSCEVLPFLRGGEEREEGRKRERKGVGEDHGGSLSHAVTSE